MFTSSKTDYLLLIAYCLSSTHSVSLLRCFVCVCVCSVTLSICKVSKNGSLCSCVFVLLLFSYILSVFHVLVLKPPAILPFHDI